MSGLGSGERPGTGNSGPHGDDGGLAPFDVFLSFSSADRPLVTDIARRLEDDGVTPFLDDWSLIPGTPSQEALEDAIAASPAIAVCIGPGGLGRMEVEEMRGAIEEHTRRADLRVIPVLLPGASTALDDIPLFLRRFTWCDLRGLPADDAAWSRFLAGIAGEAPGSGRGGLRSRGGEPAPHVPGDLEVARILRDLGVAGGVWRRATVLERVRGRLDASALPVVLRGLPGSGSTSALAAVAFDRADAHPRAVALRFRGPASLEPAYAIEVIGRVLHDVGRGPELPSLWDIPRERALHDQVEALDDLGALVLVDELDRAPELVRDALMGLTGANGARLVATGTDLARIDPAHQPVGVGSLSRVEAVELVGFLSSKYFVEFSPDVLVDSIPPAVSSHARSLATLVLQLRDLPLDVLLAGGVALHATDVRLVQLSVEATAPKDQVSLAAVDAVGPTTFTDLRALHGVFAGGGASRAMGDLVGRSLVQRLDDLLEVPPLVGEALDTARPGLRHDVRDEIVTSLVTSLVAASDAPRPVHLTPPMARSIAHLASVLADQEPELLARLATEAVLESLNHQGHWKEYLVLAHLGSDANQVLGRRDEALELRLRLVRKLPQVGDRVGAREAMAWVEERSAGLGAALQAEIHSHRALLATLVGDAQTALEELQMSRTLRVQLDDQDGLLVVDKLSGNIHLQLREIHEARALYLAALDRPESDATITDRMDVEISLTLCEPPDGRAEATLRTLIARMEHAGYRAGLPRACLHLALAVERRDPWQALDLARQAMDTDDGDVRREAISLAWRIETFGLTVLTTDEGTSDGA